jgi:GAF domain-containing protein
MPVEKKEELMIGIERLADVFVDVADTLVTDFDVIDFLHTVAAHAAEITGTSAAGLMLSTPDGRLHYMGASNEEVGLLELFQVQNDEGPCLDCFRTGEAVIEVDLSREPRRWPAFAPQALEAGIRSVHAFPMRVRDRVIGALNVFGTTAAVLSPDEARVVQALADVATIAILQERALHQAEIVTEQLHHALNSRIVIEQAKGAVARSFGVSVDQAFDLIRGYARAERILLTDLAHRLVESPEGPELLRGA